MDILEVAKARALIASGTARAVRQSARLSLRDVAQALGVDKSAVHRWETGDRTPRGELAIRYAKLVYQLIAMKR